MRASTSATPTSTVAIRMRTRTGDIEATTVRAVVEPRQEIFRAGSLPPSQTLRASGETHAGAHGLGMGATRWRAGCDMLLLALVTSLLLAWAVAATPITTRGEAREALVVRELTAGGSWVAPRRQGKLATKPPLYHWLAATLARRRGFSDAVVRAPSAAGALAVMLVTFALAFRLGGRATAWVAAGVLAGTSNFWRWGTEARVDMLLAACVSAALAGFLAWLAAGAPAGRPVFWLGAALGVLTKGPIGAVLPGMVALVTMLVARAWRRWRELVATPALPVALVLVAGWYALAAWVGGDDFVRTHLFVENLERLLGVGRFDARADRSTFVALRAFGSHLLPWNLALGWYLWRWRRGLRASMGERVLHVWWITTLGLLALSAGQRPAYLLPLYAPMAALAAHALVSGVGPRLETRRARAAAVCGLVLVALGVLGGTGWWRARRARDQPLVPFAAAVAAHLPAGAEVRATHAVSESDVLVLAHLLGRPLRRAKPDCGTAIRYYLGPSSLGDRAPMRVLARLEGGGRERLALLECGGAEMP